jgi:hypothetical protein
MKGAPSYFLNCRDALLARVVGVTHAHDELLQVRRLTHGFPKMNRLFLKCCKCHYFEFVQLVLTRPLSKEMLGTRSTLAYYTAHRDCGIRGTVNASQNALTPNCKAPPPIYRKATFSNSFLGDLYLGRPPQVSVQVFRPDSRLLPS